MRQAGMGGAPFLEVSLRGGGACALWPDRIGLPDATYPVAELTWAGVVVDPTFPVAPGVAPVPALGLRLRDGRAPLVAPADPREAWRLAEALYQLRPDLRIGPPPGWQPALVGAGAASDGAPRSSSDTVLAGIAHLSIFFAPVLLPLILWLATRSSAPYASRQAKQAFVFHLGLLVVAFVAVASWVALLLTTATGAVALRTPQPVLLPIVGALVLWGLAGIVVLLEFCFSIYGAVQAFQGRPFSYPLLSRL